jgi:hypothetical protein
MLICLNILKNLILVPIERFSVVLRHANRFYECYYKVLKIFYNNEK